ncbi:MAG: LytR C-terminal domain-containing protein [Candidatus Bipolaricaulaceae bacterium]
MRRVLIVAGLVLIGLGLALYFTLSRTEVSRSLAQGKPVRILWALRLLPQDPPDLAVAITLLPRGEVHFLLIPGTLAVPTQSGWSTLSAVYAAEGLKGWGQRLSSLLEFPFLWAVEVGPGDWDKLLERAGGVVVRLEERLIYREEAGGLSLDLPAGEQLLFGQDAREFLAYGVRGAGDPAIPLVAGFFRDLLDRIWAKGKSVLPSLQMDKTWEIREFWRRALSLPEEKVALETLPIVAEDSRLMPDFVNVRKLEGRVVLGRSFLTRDEVKVVVLNGTRERFLATKVAGWLSARGFKVVGVGSADRSDYTKTFLVVGKNGEEKASLLRQVLPKDLVVTTAQAFGMEKLGGWPTGADLVLVIGAGFEVGG